MNPDYDLIVVIPVGPVSRTEFVEDTMASVRHYTSGRVKFILIDDSQQNLTATINQAQNDVDILTISHNLGKVGGLYISLSRAFLHAYTHYNFSILLRMDDDALMTGPDPHLDGLKYLAEHPQTGIMGRYISGNYSPDIFGNIHDNYWPRKQLIKDVFTWKAIRRPIANLTLRRILLRGIENGYELGENVQGGAYFLTRNCIGEMRGAGLLPNTQLKTVNLCEDHLFSLMTRMVGLQIGDLSGAGQPFGVSWKGLPASPEQLVAAGKKIIHSVRHWHQLDEQNIRRFFHHQRSRTRSLQPGNEVEALQ